jgi:hypothetical protein
MRPLRTNQGADLDDGFSQVHEVDGAGDFVARQSPLCAQAHIPRGVGGKFHREAWCKTTQRTEHGPRRGEPAQRPSVSGYGRSMAETLATLGAAGLQNGAPGTGGHTVAKAVLTAFLAIVRLKGALHGASSWARAPTQMRADWTSKDHRLGRHGACSQHHLCEQSVRLGPNKNSPGPRVRKLDGCPRWGFFSIHRSCYVHLSCGFPVGACPHPVDTAVERGDGCV